MSRLNYNNIEQDLLQPKSSIECKYNMCNHEKCLLNKTVKKMVPPNSPAFEPIDDAGADDAGADKSVDELFEELTITDVTNIDITDNNDTEIFEKNEHFDENILDLIIGKSQKSIKPTSVKLTPTIRTFINKDQVHRFDESVRLARLAKSRKNKK